MPEARRPNPLCDKIGRDTLRRVIDDFYEQLLADPRLGGHFRHLRDINGHKARFADFWWTAMGGWGADPPIMDMVGTHQPLALSVADLHRWLALLQQAACRHLPPELATAWTQMATGIGQRLVRMGVIGAGRNA